MTRASSQFMACTLLTKAQAHVSLLKLCRWGGQAAAGQAPPATDEQDALGRRGPMSRTSKFKGVTRHRRSGRHAPALALPCMAPCRPALWLGRAPRPQHQALWGAQLQSACFPGPSLLMWCCPVLPDGVWMTAVCHMCP